MATTIITPSEEVLVIEQEIATLVEVETNTILVIEESEPSGLTVTDEQIILVVESETAILVEAVVESVLVVEAVEVVTLEVVEQGPPGPPGPVAEVVAGTIDLIYTDDKLTVVDLPDGTYKLLSYFGGLLTRVDHVKSGQTVRKDFVYTGGRLEAVNTSFV